MTLYQDTLHDDAIAIVAAARLNPDSFAAPVPSCLGWNVIDLVLHLGAVHRHAVKIVANHEREHVPISPDDLNWLQLAQPYLHWLLSGQAPTDEPLPLEVLTWFEQGAALLQNVVYGADPREPVWTWAPDKRVAHYQRMLAIETAIHRWDTQQAHGQAQPIGTALAHDGIDHTFDVMLPARRDWSQPRPSNGESYYFHQTDGDGEWTVRFNPDAVLVSHEPDASAVITSGTASDLFLFLWGRIPAQRLGVSGDAALLDLYFELVPPR